MFTSSIYMYTDTTLCILLCSYCNSDYYEKQSTLTFFSEELMTGHYKKMTYKGINLTTESNISESEEKV